MSSASTPTSGRAEPARLVGSGISRRCANRTPSLCVITAVAGRSDLLEDWVGGCYPRAYRTAVMICGNRADAEEAVQDAFLRVWRFRDALPPDSRRNAWLYRVLVNACYSKLRQEVPRRERERERSE